LMNTLFDFSLGRKLELHLNDENQKWY